MPLAIVQQLRLPQATEEQAHSGCVYADLTTGGSRSQLQQPLVVLLDGEALCRSVRVESYIVNHMMFRLLWCGCTCLEHRMM